MYQHFFKLFFDFILGIILFCVSVPFFIVIVILISVISGGNPFFIQKRSGRNGRIFKIIKFKTMNDRRDEDGNLLPDSERLTTVGAFIRKTSLDELPQIINVIRGDMSFVGPRPLLVEYLPLYNDFQQQRHRVKPGITGWAQVNGRNAISWDEKFKLDVYYVNNISFFLDVKILLLTVKKVFCSEGINSTSEVTMVKFNGNN